MSVCFSACLFVARHSSLFYRRCAPVWIFFSLSVLIYVLLVDISEIIAWKQMYPYLFNLVIIELPKFTLYTFVCIKTTATPCRYPRKVWWFHEIHQNKICWLFRYTFELMSLSSILLRSMRDAAKKGRATKIGGRGGGKGRANKKK